MNEWLLLVVASFVGSLFSLVGGMLLLAKRLSVERVQRFAVPFAAGALLAAAFLDLLPEAIEEGGDSLDIMALVLTGFVVFFILERFLGWFHHHHDHSSDTKASQPRRHSTKALIVIGDTLHNAIDGLVIGAAFLAEPITGIITTAAIAAHEIPQEIGDFGVLLSLGMRRRNVLLVNILSTLATVIAAVSVYALGGVLASYEPVLLALAAGMFIYISASDLVPTIHDEQSAKVANYQTMILLFGVVFIGITTTLTHSFLETFAASGDAHSEEQHDEHKDEQELIQ